VTLRLLDHAENWAIEAKVKVNAALSYLDGLQASITAEIAAAITALKAAANTWTAAQTISGAGNTTLFTVTGADDGAAVGPFVVLKRTSASPAANDFLLGLFFQGKDSGGTDTNYVGIIPQIIDPTDTSEDSRLILQLLVAGAVTNVLTLGPGVQIGTPTGGDPGADNLNISGVIQKDGTQVVAGRVTGYTNAMTGTADRATSYATGTITLVQLAERVKAIQDDITTHGLIGA
jgi:hypothetical protein